MVTHTPSASAHQLYLHQLALFLRDSRLVQALWTSYTHEHCDPETGQPRDAEAHRLRAAQRDADLLFAFGTVFVHADTLVEVAQQQLARLPDPEQMPHHAGQLEQLRDTTARLYALRCQFMERRHTPHPDRGVQSEESDAALYAQFCAEARPFLDQWTTHGQAVLDLNALATQPMGRQGKASTATHTPSPAASAPAAPTGRGR
ncbi:hypothetical protein [Streptomyces sp. MNP-20]|uniref:hypothetical protein n=1 Tax=Streptomyces sp. MNP-20 TaxID=2721165 RepID=UPI0015555C09|nr:hypothetical protein [Streptomyces sp. MNP-20]